MRLRRDGVDLCLRRLIGFLVAKLILTANAVADLRRSSMKSRGDPFMEP
jgi:hypothetical protein